MLVNKKAIKTYTISIYRLCLYMLKYWSILLIHKYYIHILTKKSSQLFKHVWQKQGGYWLENTMFCSEVSNGTSTLQNNIVYELRPIQFSATFKHEQGGKPNTHISCVVANLQTSNKRSSNKAITKYFCTSLSRILQIQVISKYIYLHASFFCVLSRAFAYKYIYGHKCAGNFSSPSCILS